jgi:hypothetical protein
MSETSTLLPFNKSRQLTRKTITGAGTSETIINVEQSAVSLTFHMSAFTVGSLVTFEVYHIGDHEDDQVWLYTSPNFTSEGDTPFNIELDAPGPLLVRVISNDTITYTLRGKAINAHTPAVQEVHLSNETTELAVWRKDMLQLMQANNELLQTVINHLRVISDINADEGETY